MSYGSRTLAGILLALALAASACSGSSDAEDASGGDESSSAVSSGDGQTEGLRIGLALPGKQNDQGFSEAHYVGLELAKDSFDFEANVIDNTNTPEDTVAALTNLAADNNLVIGVGAEFDEAGRVVAPKFPDVVFMVVNGSTDESIPNLYAYGIRQGVPAHVATVLAASLDGVEVIGYVGGLEIPPVTQVRDTIEAAAPALGLTAITTITGDFNDVALAKSAAEAQLAEGADLIYGLVDAGFTGVIQAANESGENPYLFGTIFPRCDQYENTVGTAIAGSDALINSMIKDFADGTLPETPLYYGLENPEIQHVELCPPFQTDEMQALLDETVAAIVDGSIVLPEGV